MAATQWNESLIDGEMLVEDVQYIVHKGIRYNIKIEVKKYEDLVNATFSELRGLSNHDDKKEIEWSVDNNKLTAISAKWVRGSHPALHYRGNALKRHKVWFQEQDEGFYAYKYTGWQKKVLNATFKIDSTNFSATSALVNAMKEDVEQNHWIATMYEDGFDYIGMHSDKTKTWKKCSSFQVIKWGFPRIFKVTINDHEEVDKCTVLFSKILPAGTSLIVDMDTNERTRHGVPVMEGCTKVSGSIVGRDIETFISFEESKKMIEQAERDRLKRKLKKEERNANKKVKV